MGQYVKFKSQHGFIVGGTIVEKRVGNGGHLIYAFKQENSPAARALPLPTLRPRWLRPLAKGDAWACVFHFC